MCFYTTFVKLTKKSSYANFSNILICMRQRRIHVTWYVAIYRSLDLNPNKSVFSFLRTLTAWHCPHLHVAVAECQPCSDRSISPARLQQLWSHAGTDERTSYRYIDPASHTMRAVPIIRVGSIASENWSTGARFTKYLTTILRLSYDNVKVTIDLRRATNLPNILRRTQGFFRYDLLAKS